MKKEREENAKNFLWSVLFLERRDSLKSRRDKGGKLDTCTTLHLAHLRLPVTHPPTHSGLLTYFTFLVLVALYTFSRVGDSLNGYSMNAMVKDFIVDEEFTVQDSHIKKTYHDIGDQNEWWQYVNGVLLNQVYPEECYLDGSQGFKFDTTRYARNNDNLAPCAGFLYDGKAIVIGGLKVGLACWVHSAR